MTFINHKGILATALLLGFSASTVHAERGDVVLKETFDTEEDFARWEVIDLNGGRAWEYLNGTAAYMLDWQTSLPGDDWLVSPAFELKPHTAYEIRFYMNVLTKVESMRMALAPSNDPSVLSQHFLAEYDHVTSADKGEKVMRFCTEDAGGTYYIGFYAYSDPDQHRIEVDNIQITDLGPSSIPDDVVELTGVAGTQGALTATIKFRTPDKAASGEPLSELSAIDIYRGNGATTPVHTISQPPMGAELSWTDLEAKQGYNHYSVIARNSDGESQPVTADVYVGVDAPSPVARVNARVESDLSITVSWDAPETSVHGGYVDYSGIRYKVKRNNKTIYTDLAETHFNDPTPGTNAQQGQVKYTVTPVAGTMTGESTISMNVVTGKPLSMPYAESFANRQMVSPWALDADAADFEWKRSSDSEDEYAISSQDMDNGFIEAESSMADRGEQARYVTPIFDLSSLSHPLLTFWFYEGRDPWYDPEWEGRVNDRLQVQWRRLGEEWQDLEGATFYQNQSTNGWVKCEVQLPRVEGAWVNLGLLAIADAENYAYRNIAVDNITIAEAPFVHDVRMDSLTAERLRVDVGEDMLFTVTLTNRSYEETLSSVTLLREGEPYATASVTLPALQKTQVTFCYTATYADAYNEDIVWSAIVESEGDEVENNVSAPLHTSVRHADVPVIGQLTAQMTGQHDVLLCWQAATSVEGMAWNAPLTVTDGFDTYEPFAISGFGDWTVVDRDQAPTMYTSRIPAAYPHKGEPMAFQIFNVEEAGVWTEDNHDNAFSPRNDMQYLACPSADYPYENDDWLITPRLDGRSHQISFYASAATYDSEWILVYYSLTDNHPDSFIPLTDKEQIFVHEGWTRYEYRVPEGSRYFAVRCIRRSVFLYLDDFTYDAYQGHEEDRQLLGYNIYRDGVQINAEPVALEDADGFVSYRDEVTEDKQYTYCVTAVYDIGESPYSEEVSVDAAAAIEAITEETCSDEQALYDLFGMRQKHIGKGIYINRGQRIVVLP